MPQPQSLQQQISESDWDQWARSPATQKFVRMLEESIADTAQAWSEKAFLGATDADTLRYNHNALGEISGIRKVLSAIEDMKLESKDE